MVLLEKTKKFIIACIIKSYEGSKMYGILMYEMELYN